MAEAYAAGTSVSVPKTKQEIEELLRKRGAKTYGVGSDPAVAVIFFELQSRQVQIKMRLPRADVPPEKLKHANAERRMRWAEQAERERWRGLLLTLKAKFAAIDSEIETFDQAFLPHLAAPGGGTVGEQLLPALEEAYKTGAPIRTPFLLGSGGAQR